MEEEEGLVEIKIENVEVKVETEAEDTNIDQISHAHHHDCVTSGQYVFFQHSNILTLLYNRPI